jgi:hypothetical protein
MGFKFEVQPINTIAPRIHTTILLSEFMDLIYVIKIRQEEFTLADGIKECERLPTTARLGRFHFALLTAGRLRTTARLAAARDLNARNVPPEIGYIYS